MYGIIFSVDDDVNVCETDKDIYDLVQDDLPKIFKRFGFERIQHERPFSYDFYIYRGDDMLAVVKIMTALKELAWFKESVTDIKAFKIEQLSDFTNFMQEF